MKQLIFTVFVILLLASIGSAQSIGVFGGLTGSSFEDQTEAATGIEAGASFVIDALPIIEAGVEFSTFVSPFETSVEAFGIKTTTTTNQTMFGVFGKFTFGLPALTPYARAGVGYYTGSVETKTPAGTVTTDFKNTLGFNVGAGVDTFIGLYGEFLYHIVSREADAQNAQSFGANYWALRVGYYFSLL